MNYLGDKVFGNFKPPRNPNRRKKESAASKRPGMDPQHVKDIGKLSSCVSGRKPCDAHHLRVKDERGVGLKATDRWCVPLTREEHMEIHKLGPRKELAWFQARGISDPFELAASLWTWRGEGNHDKRELIVETHRDMTKGARI